MLCRIPWYVKSEPVTHFSVLIKNNYRNLMNTMLVQNIVLTREDGTLVRAKKGPAGQRIRRSNIFHHCF